MTPRMNANLIKVLLFVVIFMVLLVQSIFTEARALPANPVKETHLIPGREG